MSNFKEDMLRMQIKMSAEQAYKRFLEETSRQHTMYGERIFLAAYELGFKKALNTSNQDYYKEKK